MSGEGHHLIHTCVSSQIEIKNHIFFSPINWDDLNAKKITPPFNPNVVRSFLMLLQVFVTDRFMILHGSEAKFHRLKFT